ncbi:MULTISPECIES: barstar family protein [Nocardia]|uniref:Barstar family protein n=1 Tax=Nocardia aurea TaxID=2144174 RepID=A0ABV3FQC6_9NOCA|nr:MULTISPECIES: barstar family protein [Nocardia]
MNKPVPLSQFLARPVALGAAPMVAAVSKASGPALGALSVDAAELSSLRSRAPSGYQVRELRSAKMRGLTGLFDEFAAAFQFPYYFGANKDAFDECLRDLDDFIGKAPGYIVVLRTSDELLADAPREREWFTTAMRDCADYWARREVAFRVIFQGKPAPPRIAPLSLD